MRGMELLARCIEWDDEKLKALQDEQRTLNEEIEKKNQLLGKIKERQTRQKEKEQKEKEWETLLPKEEEKKESGLCPTERKQGSSRLSPLDSECAQQGGQAGWYRHLCRLLNGL